jgi:transcription antitermination factor NusB
LIIVESSVDRRTTARELAMQALYQLDVQGEGLLTQIDRFFLLSCEDELARQLASQWTKGTWEHIKECDGFIGGAIRKWQLSRLSQVDRSILRLSVYQLKFCGDMPPKAVINEAIEMAKKYSTEASPGFVNAVLDAVLKSSDVNSQVDQDQQKGSC